MGYGIDVAVFFNVFHRRSQMSIELRENLKNLFLKFEQLKGYL